MFQKKISWKVERKQVAFIELSRRGSRILKWGVNFGLDDDNATSPKHGNEAVLDYMLESVCSKWINWLAEPVIAYSHSPPQSEKSNKSNIIQYLRDKEKKKARGLRKRGWKFTHFTSPGSAPAQSMKTRVGLQGNTLFNIAHLLSCIWRDAWILCCIWSF